MDYQILIDRLGTFIIRPTMEMLFAAAILLFVWGLVQFLWSLDEGGEQATGKAHMFWGIIGIFIMVSIWGILSIVTATFGFSPNPNSPDLIDVNRANTISPGFQFK